MEVITAVDMIMQGALLDGGTQWMSDQFGLTFSRPEFAETRSQFSEMRISDLISERSFKDKISHIYKVHKYSTGKDQQLRYW